jgi:hypothetical protein
VKGLSGILLKNQKNYQGVVVVNISVGIIIGVSEGTGVSEAAGTRVSVTILVGVSVGVSEGRPVVGVIVGMRVSVKAPGAVGEEMSGAQGGT